MEDVSSNLNYSRRSFDLLTAPRFDPCLPRGAAKRAPASDNEGWQLRPKFISSLS